MIALDPVATLAVRLAIAALFAGAVVHKLRDPGAFAATVAAYLRGTPAAAASLAWIAAGAATAMEIAVVALCLFPGPGAGAAAAAMLLLYAGAMGANIARGNVLLDCGCGWGIERQPVSPALVLRNLGLAAVAALLFLPAGRRAMGAFDIANAAICAGLLLLTYALGNQLILNAQQLKARRI